MIQHRRPWRLGSMAALLLLGGCLATGSGAGGDPSAASSAAEGAGGANAFEAFSQKGYHLQDVRTMAGLMAGDIPHSPRIVEKGNAEIRVVIDAQHIRQKNEGVRLNRQAFAHDLRRALDEASPQSIRYRSVRDAGTASRRLQAGPQRGGGGGEGGGKGGRGGDQASAVFVMNIDVMALPAQSEQVGAQRYMFQLVAAEGQQLVWEGSYDLDAPGAAATP